MTINVYDEGDLVRVSGVLKDSAGADVDPSALAVLYQKPGVALVTLVYGTDVSVVKDSPGNYHVDINCDVPGQYGYWFESTGTGQAAEKGEFVVEPSGHA